MMDFQGDLKLESFEEFINWVNVNGLMAKGYFLFWFILKVVLEWVKKYDLEIFMKFVEVWVCNLIVCYDGKVKLWDVVNEVFWEFVLKNLFNWIWLYIESMDNLVDYIFKVICWGWEELFGVKFVINDYGIGVVNKFGLVDQNGEGVIIQC